VKIKSLEEAKAAAFRGAYRGLRHQGWRQSASAFGCLYNSPVGHCGVGWLLRNLPQKFNCASICNLHIAIGNALGDFFAPPLAKWWRKANAEERCEFVEFLGGIQRAHDKSDSPSDMRRRFEAMRVANGWPVPSVLPGENPEPQQEAA